MALFLSLAIFVREIHPTSESKSAEKKYDYLIKILWKSIFSISKYR